MTLGPRHSKSSDVSRLERLTAAIAELEASPFAGLRVDLLTALRRQRDEVFADLAAGIG